MSAGLPIFFTRGADRFEIFGEARPDGFVYVGCHNGAQSVTGKDKAYVLRLLIEKHVLQWEIA
jgi:hypothetical protein